MIGLGALARILGVSRQRAWQLARRAGVGTPTVRGWRLSEADVAAVVAARRPRGRPRRKEK